MVKKKTNAIDGTEDSIRSKFGDSILVSAKSLMDEKQHVISVSPALDMLFGGGIVAGSMIVATGPAKAGKTVSSLEMAAAALEAPSDVCGERHLFFLNIEGRIKGRDLRGINRLLPFLEQDRVHLIGSTKDNILSGEDYLEISEQLINEKPGAIVIMDSISNLCSSARRKNDIRDRFRDDMPLLIANFCKRVSNVIPVNKTIVIGITHMMANQGYGRAESKEASGNILVYATDIKLRATHATPWEVNKQQIGQDVHWTSISTALGPPGVKVSSKLRYGWGIDRHSEIINVCVDLGLIKKGGAWYTILETGAKAQGLEGMRNLLLEDAGLYKSLNDQFAESMGLQSSS